MVKSLSFFPCLTLSQKFCCLHMHLGEINLRCCLMVRAISMFIYPVKADILYVFCMCNLIDSNTQDSEVINNYFDNPTIMTQIFQDKLQNGDWFAALHCIWIILLFLDCWSVMTLGSLIKMCTYYSRK